MIFYRYTHTHTKFILVLYLTSSRFLAPFASEKNQVLRLSSPVASFYDVSTNSRSRVVNGTCYDVVVVATDAPAAGYLLGGEWKCLGCLGCCK